MPFPAGVLRLNGMNRQGIQRAIAQMDVRDYPPSGTPATMPKLYTPREAAQVLGISYAALKQWIYLGKLKSMPTAGGHHRIPEAEIDRLLPRIPASRTPEKRRRTFRRISGRNQLIGRVTELKIEGLIAQVTLAIGEQHITSIITADAVREMRLKKGQIAAALIKST